MTDKYRKGNMMTDELSNAVLNEDTIEISKYSSSAILSYHHDKYKNLFLLAARTGRVNAAKAIIEKLESDLLLERLGSLGLDENQSTDNHNSIIANLKESFINFITARDYLNRNAWTLAAIADSQSFLEYLYSLKASYSDFFQLGMNFNQKIIVRRIVLL